MTAGGIPSYAPTDRHPGGPTMQVTLDAAATDLRTLIDAVERGERVVITRDGAPAAELVAPRRPNVRFGRLKGKVPDFPEGTFDPMTEDELRDWGAV